MVLIMKPEEEKPMKKIRIFALVLFLACLIWAFASCDMNAGGTPAAGTGTEKTQGEIRHEDRNMYH